eukprot:scaffold3466_cov132-Isochrysis_galbana.AAC.2
MQPQHLTIDGCHSHVAPHMIASCTIRPRRTCGPHARALCANLPLHLYEPGLWVSQQSSCAAKQLLLVGVGGGQRMGAWCLVVVVGLVRASRPLAASLTR